MTPREEFCYHAGRHSMPLTVVGKLLRLSKAHESLCVRLCNEVDDGSIYQRLESVEAQLEALGTNNGFNVVHQRDPRGCTVRLLVGGSREIPVTP